MENKKNKKIAVFLSSFRAGGGEKNLVNLANSLVDLGFEVDIPVIKPVGQLKEKITSKINIISIDAGRIVFSIPKMITYLRKNKPDMVISTDEFTHIISLISRKLSKIETKIVFRMGNMFSILFSHYKGFKQKVIIPFITKRIYKYADIFVANSFGVADDVLKFFKISKNKIKVIHNPKSINEIRKKGEEKAGHSWLDNKTLPVILFVGRIREQKDIPTLIKAFAEVICKKPARLLFVGVGREQKRLEKLIEELNIKECVDFFGFSDNPYSFMTKADIFVTTSIWEGFSNSLQEAMICGASVIATDCSSGPREMIAPDTDVLYRMSEGIEYGKYGILVPMKGIKELSKAIQSLLEKENMREKYSELSLERGNDFDLKKILNEYLKALDLS